MLCLTSDQGQASHHCNPEEAREKYGKNWDKILSTTIVKIRQTLLRVHELLAPSTILGVWFIALVLWLPFEYYYSKVGILLTVAHRKY